MQCRYADAEAAYRQVLAREPRNVVALNNLAWLLAHRDDGRDEALNLARQAVEVAGPLPALLDTRAVVHLNRGEGEQAGKDLEQALEDEPTPALYFHLARAQALSQDRAAAAATLRKATKAGFKAEALSPLERGSYLTLLKELEES
jgi:tetratricopeptide (TPR) repeat protein